MEIRFGIYLSVLVWMQQLLMPHLILKSLLWAVVFFQIWQTENRNNKMISKNSCNWACHSCLAETIDWKQLFAEWGGGVGVVPNIVQLKSFAVPLRNQLNIYTSLQSRRFPSNPDRVGGSVCVIQSSGLLRAPWLKANINHKPLISYSYFVLIISSKLISRFLYLFMTMKSTG